MLHGGSGGRRRRRGTGRWEEQAKGEVGEKRQFSDCGGALIYIVTATKGE